nr:hypothetical protein [Angustibacter aerolatus]
MAFGVVWHTNYDEFPDCTKRTVVTRNTPVPVEYPPSSAPVPPDPHSCAYNGGGGTTCRTRARTATRCCATA